MVNLNECAINLYEVAGVIGDLFTILAHAEDKGIKARARSALYSFTFTDEEINEVLRRRVEGIPSTSLQETGETVSVPSVDPDDEPMEFTIKTWNPAANIRDLDLDEASRLANEWNKPILFDIYTLPPQFDELFRLAIKVALPGGSFDHVEARIY